MFSHHDDFRRCRRIISFMKNTAAIPGLHQSTSPPHHLQRSTCLVWSDLGYFKRHSVISTMGFLLHNGRHDRKPGRWDLGWCKLLFGASFSLSKTWLDCEVAASFFSWKTIDFILIQQHSYLSTLSDEYEKGFTCRVQQENSWNTRELYKKHQSTSEYDILS